MISTAMWIRSLSYLVICESLISSYSILFMWLFFNIRMCCLNFYVLTSYGNAGFLEGGLLAKVTYLNFFCRSSAPEAWRDLIRKRQIASLPFCICLCAIQGRLFAFKFQLKDKCRDLGFFFVANAKSSAHTGFVFLFFILPNRVSIFFPRLAEVCVCVELKKSNILFYSILTESHLKWWETNWSLEWFNFFPPSWGIASRVERNEKLTCMAVVAKRWIGLTSQRWTWLINTEFK